MAAREIISIESVEDPRIGAYLNLKERDLAREGGRFIAEAELVVRRLLRSGYRTESVLVARDRVERIIGEVPAGVAVYAAERGVVNQIIGFKFHSGIMACAFRGEPKSVEGIAAAWGEDQEVTAMVLPETANTENMGSMIRLASAFGVELLLLGEKCCDPFYRQSVRVSMGNIFSVPLVRSVDLRKDLSELKERWGVELVATVVDSDAEALAAAGRGKRVGLLFGAEGPGLSGEDVAMCDRRVTIPMKRGTDSLNVGVAAGVFLYHFTQYAGGGGSK